MRIITLNVNGIRAAARKGLFLWLISQNADFICLQETRAYLEKDCAPDFLLPNYYSEFYDATNKKGYSGVSIYSKLKPLKIHRGIGWDIADTEGRYLQFDFKNFSIVSLYVPSGTSGDDRQKLKYTFMDKFTPILKKIVSTAFNEKRSFAICGDWNIAHKEIDLKNWRTNQKNSGFLPEERAWLDQVFGEIGLIDAFRVVNHEENQYTWWSNFGRAWERNTGWRIDYQVVTKELAKKVRSTFIYKDQRFSDHAPLIIDYDFTVLL